MTDFAQGMCALDARGVQAVNKRSGLPFIPGIGPFAEADLIRLVMAELSAGNSMYSDHALNVPYADGSRRRCDLCIGKPPSWRWAIELKLFRLLGDNGKVNDNMLMHILSPYPAHRSALTDCLKLAESGPVGHRAVVIFGYESDEWPMAPAMKAFEALARDLVRLSDPVVSELPDLIHPIHARGWVYGWELLK